ncbi:hypothetical protein CEXT_284891 [Caerostris extrusa]|uniref:Uncharacterized protein n=1 Tax=Caerostris extrusa TaxID=172846 RepID=A0AAV4S8N5_CAEEX|nr:hypothetical protein CEXT_284891 [Caerostris extrusa]
MVNAQDLCTPTLHYYNLVRKYQKLREIHLYLLPLGGQRQDFRFTDMSCQSSLYIRDNSANQFILNYRVSNRAPYSLEFTELSTKQTWVERKLAT